MRGLGNSLVRSRVFAGRSVKSRPVTCSRVYVGLVEVSDDCSAVYIGPLRINRFKPSRASATYD